METLSERRWEEMMADLMRWSPFDELRRLSDEFDRGLGAWFRPGSAGVLSPANVSADGDGWRVRIALPGIAPEDVEVNVAGRTVHMRALEQEGDARVTRYEELVTLPESVDVDKIAASFRHGLLELTLPKKEEIKPRRIEIATTEAKALPKAA
jgi:HSP20 family protein